MAKAERDVYEVHLDAAGLAPAQRVGRLYRHAERTGLPAAFEYDEAWLASDHRFLLDPRLDLWRGEQHPPAQAPAFGVFMDSAPDRWGKVLMERREAAQADRESRAPRRLQEMDFLLGVHDATRMGALRFRRPPVKDAPLPPFLDNSPNAVPPETDLRALADISRKLEEPGVEKLPEFEKWLALLIAPGTSLGGARPKANFRRPDQSLWLAKFPAREDRYDVGGWEYLTHQLAEKARIDVPRAHPAQLTDRHRTFCVERFDRRGSSRRMYSSAMTLLERQDGDAQQASYLDLAEFLSDNGAQGCIEADLAQLYRRLVFNVMVGNRDDHLRNHGFVREPSGWRLAPAFDVNPNLFKDEHALTLDGSVAAPSMKAVARVAELFRLQAADAARIVREVHDAVRDWEVDAAALQLPGAEIARMRSVFLQG